MPQEQVGDVVVLLPGITGSVLQKDGRDVWALSAGAFARALKTLGRNIRDLELEQDDPAADDLGDGIRASRLVGDTHLIPGLWKIDGYGKVAKHLVSELGLTPGENFFEFPYDWRRDNRVHGRRLARESREWLNAWRTSSGNEKAKLILVGHSMGGLVSRAFLELEDGWKSTRMLVTFGTPYRGSLNALGFVANGLSKRVGPVTLANFTDLIRSFTSVYQLLPIYRCVDTGGEDLQRITEVADIRVPRDRATAALEFHHDIRDAVRSHQSDPAYAEQGYEVKPIVGTFQPTYQSASLTGVRLELVNTYKDEDQGGDGTVPSVSATPIELSNQQREVYIRQRHASLQNADATLDHLVALVLGLAVDQSEFFAPGDGISLDVSDVYLSTEPVRIRARPEVEWRSLEASVQDVATGTEVAAGALTGDGEWRELELGPLPESTYRVTVTGDANAAPVADVFAVIDEGVDIEGS
jgi:pimeloyl-ACP methyl ester carboxylesterase